MIHRFNICSSLHDEIVYARGIACPLCENIKKLQSMEVELTDARNLLLMVDDEVFSEYASEE